MTRASIITIILACACTVETEHTSYKTQPLTASGCDEGRRVGIPSVGGRCPRPVAGSGWAVSYLFQQPSLITDAGQPFCLYEFTGSGPVTTTGLPSEPGTADPGDVWTDADCLGVIPLGSGDAAEITTERHTNASRIQMGQPETLPALPGLPQPVRVAILDSSVSNGPNDLEPTSGDFLHGRAVSMPIREHACPRGRSDICIPDFDMRLVLDQNGGVGGPAGHHGSPITLALELEDVIADKPANVNMVIPLAVGWHPNYNHRNADPVEDEANTIKAVRAVLEWAVCENVLVLAAAGNRTGAGDTDGLLCPACWEEHVVACDDQRPVVYAIGGLNPDGSPLAISRDEGQPPLAAPALGVAAENMIEGVDGPPLGSWTGTSMAVAHVGAAATLVWGYLPGLQAREVMDLIADASETVDEEADVCVDTMIGAERCPPVRRVTACDTLEEIFDPSSQLCTTHTCPEELACEARPDLVVSLSAEDLDKLRDLADEDLINGEPFTAIPGLTCGTGDVFGNGKIDANQEYCPWGFEPSYAITPHELDAQPGSDPCGACAVFTDNKYDEVYLAIDSEMPGYLHWPTLSSPSFGALALEDGMQPPYLTSGDIVSVPLHGLNLDYSGGAQISFMWSKFENSQPIQVSVQIPVY